MTPYKNLLIQALLPLEENEARCLKRKASYYVILDGELFKKGLTTPLLKFLNNQQTDYVMRELHKGICGLHFRGHSMATKVVHVRHNWPTLKADTFDFTRRCKKCQEFANVPCTPPDNIHSMISPWPFAI